ncbi:MAG: zinc transporter ZntB [Sphingomonadaceae bacterium]|nr:zinc transporter ZntB [Sphingomonadaceae bacterium]
MESFAYSIAPDGTGMRLGPDAVALPEAAFLWRHIDGRDEKHCAWLSAQSGIPETVVAALTSVETRPRVGLVGDGALVNLRGVSLEEGGDPSDLVSVRIWVERGLLLTMNFRDTGAIAAMEEAIAARRIRDEGDFITELAHATTERLGELLARLSGELDLIEEEVIAERSGALRVRIGAARRTAIELRRHMGPQREALIQLAAGVLPIFEDNDRAHLAEAANSVTRMLEEIESIREQGAVLFEQLTDLRNERVAQRAMVLSIVSAIFLPLSYIAGLIGMNVQGIPYAQAEWAFWGIVAMNAAIAIGVLLWLRAKGWFS